MESAQRSRASSVVVVGAVMLSASLWHACSPGEIEECKDLDRHPEWKEVCASKPGAGPPTPPPPQEVPTAATVVMNCPKYPTLGQMDSFFAMRCGVGSASNSSCHYNAIPWTDFRSKDVWQRLRDAKPKAVCTKAGADNQPIGRLVNTKDWRNSILLHKTQPMPQCPPGTSTGAANTGTPMPPPLELQANVLPPDQQQGPLTPEERACLAGFVHAAGNANGP